MRGEMAEYLGEENTAEEYRALFEKGRKTLDKTFNGEYYEQHIDITDKSLLENYSGAENYWITKPRRLSIRYARAAA